MLMKKMNEHARRPPSCPSDKSGHHDAVSFALESYSGRVDQLSPVHIILVIFLQAVPGCPHSSLKPCESS